MQEAVIKQDEPKYDVDAPIKSSLDSFFEERDVVKDDMPKTAEDKPVEDSKKKITLKKEKEVASIAKPDIKKAVLDEDDDDDISLSDKPTEDPIKKDLERTKKSLAHSQKWGTKNAQRFKAGVKVVNETIKKFIEDGSLTEEEAAPLLNHFNKTESDDESLDDNPSASPYDRLVNIAKKEIERYKEYNDDDLVDEKANAFDYFMINSSKEEIENILDELYELQSKPVKLTKRMLAIGSEHLDVYRDIKEAGSLSKYFNQNKTEKERLLKKINKLEKKLLQYQDDYQPNLRIDELSDNSEFAKSTPGNSLDAFFAERDRVESKEKGRY